MKRKSHRIRTVRHLPSEGWAHGSFTGFELPHAGEYVAAFRKLFPPAILAEHIARLPPESRARLEREFGKLPTVTTPPIP